MGTKQVPTPFSTNVRACDVAGIVMGIVWVAVVVVGAVELVWVLASVLSTFGVFLAFIFITMLLNTPLAIL